MKAWIVEEMFRLAIEVEAIFYNVDSYYLLRLGSLQKSFDMDPAKFTESATPSPVPIIVVFN